MVESAVEIHNLQFTWPGSKFSLAIERLVLYRGERVFLEGASGSGKSTILSLVGGILMPQKGSVAVIGTQLSGLHASERDRFRGEHIGFVFQMFNLIPYLNVRANVLLPLRFSPARRRRLAGSVAEDEAVRILAALGLGREELLNRSVIRLSVGQQQRVAAARALIGRPDLLIADEPTSALDADSRKDYLRLLLNECRAFGTTLLFVSHDSSLGDLFDRRLKMTDFNAFDLPAG